MKLNYFLSLSIVAGTALQVMAEEPTPKPEEPKPAAAVPAPAPKPPEKAPEPAKPEPGKPAAAAPATAPAPAGDKPAEAAKPGAHKVTSGLFEIRIGTDAVFLADEKAEVSLAPKEWGDMSVLSAVAHGSAVKKGDVLVTLDLEDLDEAIAALQRNRPGAELDLKVAEQDYAALGKTTPISLEGARRSKAEAEQDLAWYEDVGKPTDERDAAELVKMYEQQLENSREELDQLQKMYKADDLTEETEEIVLRRAKSDVERAEWRLKIARQNSERRLSTSIPREHTAYQEAAQRQEIAWRKAEAVLPDALKKKERELLELRRQFEESGKKLARLEEDRKLLEVRSPRDGVVYYGSAKRGSWGGSSLIEKKLEPGGKLTAREVFMTVLDPAKLSLLVSVSEVDLARFQPGQVADGELRSRPGALLIAKLARIDPVPYANNTFDAFFAVEKLEGAGVYPGMTCRLNFEVYRAEKAITIPRTALRWNPDGSRHVLLANGQKRDVKTGVHSEKSVEILSGLKEGEEIKVP